MAAADPMQQHDAPSPPGLVAVYSDARLNFGGSP